MAAPAWATDLTTIDLDPTATGSYTAIGGGPAGLAAETDYYVQGGGTPSCLSKGAWTAAVRGMVNDTDGIPWTVPTDGVLLLWGYYAAPASLDTKAGGGLRLVAGNSATAYYEYYCGGSDTLTFESWVPYVVDPNNATVDGTVGTPTGTWSAFGLLADLPTTAGPTKGNPIAVDALRYGRHTLDYTDGDLGNGYNTFVVAEATANSLANRWGNIEFNKGAYYVQGFHSFGTATTAVDFRDSDRVIFIRACDNNTTDDAVSTGYNRFEIINSSSNVDWDNILFQSLGTRSPGVFVHTAGTLDANFCQFVNVGTFTLLSTSVLNDCVFRNTGIITAPGSDLQRSSITGFEGTANTSSLIWDVATDPNTKLDDMEFTKGSAATHAIEFGTNSPLTMTLDNITFTDYNSTDAQNDSTLHIKRTSGTVTINLTGEGTTAANIGYRTEGATVVIQATKTLTVTVKDKDGDPIETAQTAIYEGSTAVMNEDTNASGIAQVTDYNYTGDTNVLIRVRKNSSGGTRYRNFSTNATITSNGLSLDVTLQLDDVTN